MLVTRLSKQDQCEMSESFYFHDEAALLDRLSKGLQKRSQEVVFLVGSPLCYPP
jgi:hypothetical protein